MSRLLDFLDAEFCLQREESRWRAAAEHAGKRLQEEHPDAQELRRRLAIRPEARRHAVGLWLEEVRKSDDPLPGQAMVRGTRGLAWILTLLGTGLGVGWAKGILSMREGNPINLWWVLGLLVFLQIGFLLAAAGFAAWAKTRGEAWTSGFGRLLQGIHRWSWSRHLQELPSPDALAETARVERWTWLALSQRFAVAFNLGACACFLALLLFTELQFGWSTTPEEFEPRLLQASVDLLAVPWAWAAPEAWVPTPDYLAATRWDPIAEQFAQEGIDGRAWWPFLFASLVTWGLLPRLLLWLWLQRRGRRALAFLPWNHRGYQRLYALMLPTSQAASADPDHAAIPPTAQGAEGNRGVLLWGDWARTLPAQGTDLSPSPWQSFGLDPKQGILAGSGRFSTDDEALDALVEQAPLEVWILVEAGESPDKRCTGFLRALRTRLGADLPLQVLPVEYHDGAWQPPAERDLEIWSRTLGRLHDRHLFLQRGPLA